MDELVQWLGKQLDEDERIARRAGDSFRQIGETGVIVAAEGDRAEECASANWAGVAEHIVAHDPARVLRETNAKRQTLGSLADELDRTDSPWWYGDKLEKLLKLLALPYADHPDYREEWRP